MTRTSGPTATPAPLGCLVALAIPFLILGAITLPGAIGAVREGSFHSAFWYGLGTLVGFGIPYGLYVGRKRNPAGPKSSHTPFAFWAILGGASVMLGAGLLRSAMGHQADGDAEQALLLGLGAVATIALGGWITVGGWVKSQREAPLVEALNRDDPEPWRYVAEWKGGEARDTGAAGLRAKIAFAVLWNAGAGLTALFWFTSPERSAGIHDVFVGVFVAIGLVAGFRAIQAVRHAARFGTTTFRMETFPGVVGGTLAGTVLTGIDPQQGREATFRVTLRCMRRVERSNTSSSSSHNRVRTTELWVTERTVSAEIHRSDDGGRPGVAVPVYFEIPIAARPATLHHPSDRVLWRLEIAADLPGVPFRAEMEVPVFDLRDERERALELPEIPGAPGHASDEATTQAAGERPAQARPQAAARAPRLDEHGRVRDDHRRPSETVAGAREEAPPPGASSRGSRFSVEEHRGGRVDVRSETGDAAWARAGVILVVGGVVGLLVVMSSPALQGIGGIGLIPIAGIFGGIPLWLANRVTLAEILLSEFDVTLRSRAVDGGQVLLLYRELEGAEVHGGSEFAKAQSGFGARSSAEHDVQVTARDGRTWWVGLRVLDRRQAQWVAGAINRRIAAAAQGTEPGSGAGV
jgi:hypothetical protein